MTSKEWYQETFREIRPSMEVLKKTMLLTEHAQRRQYGRVKWILACIILLLGSLGCGYALRTRQIQTKDIVQYKDYKAYQEANPLQTALPQELGHGFVFVNSGVMDQSVEGEKGEEENRKLFYAVYMVSGNLAYYEYWGQSPIYFVASQLFGYQKEAYGKTEPKGSTKIGDVEICYFEEKVLCVGRDYELTQDEKEKVQKREYSVQRGGMWSEPQEKIFTSCCWEKGDLLYQVGEFDSQLSEEDWYGIVEVIFNAQ